MGKLAQLNYGNDIVKEVGRCRPDKHRVIPEAVMEEKETVEGSASSKGSTPESDEMDESDVTGVNTKDGATTSDDSLQIGGETGEYTHNTPLENEENVKENKEITAHHPSEDAIEATQATHPTQRILDNEHPAAKSSSSTTIITSTITTNTANMTAATITITNPVVPIDSFFHDEPSLSWQPLPLHSLEESPCYPIIGVDKKRGRYYCKLHPKEAESIYLDTVEHHCKYKEPSLHKTKITEGMTTKE
jgi:hypothetical protein